MAEGTIPGTGVDAARKMIEDLRAHQSSHVIKQCQVLYEATGNGTHALHAYRIARGESLPIPEWILVYLDKSIAALRTGPKTKKTVADAFELVSRGGPFATNRAREDRRNLKVIHLVDHFKTTDPQTPSPSLRSDLELNGPFWIVGQRMDPPLSAERVQEIYYEAFRTSEG